MTTTIHPNEDPMGVTRVVLPAVSRAPRPLEHLGEPLRAVKVMPAQIDGEIGGRRYDQCEIRAVTCTGLLVTVARVFGEHGECEATARAFAASRDMLEVCKAMLARLDLEPVEAKFPGSAMRETLRAAIAKAEGKESR